MVLDSLMMTHARDEALDLGIEVDPAVPGWALLRLIDWVGALAASADRLVRLPCSQGPEGSRRLRIGMTASGMTDTESAVLRAGDDGFELLARSPQGLHLMLDALAAPEASWPQGTVLAHVVADVVQAVTADGRSVEVKRSWPSGALTATLVSLVPGQNGFPGTVAVPPDVGQAWVLAAVDYMARKAISESERYGLPFAVPGKDGRAMGTSAAQSEGGALILPQGSEGVRLLQALAGLPSYPERPWCLRQTHVQAEDGGPMIYRREHVVPWEGERLCALVEELLSDLPAGGEMEVFVSEPQAVRLELRDKVTAILQGHGRGDIAVQVRSVHKQAYFETLETVLPSLHGLQVALLDIVVPEVATADRLERRGAWLPSLAPAAEVVEQALGAASTHVSVTLSTEERVFVWRAYGQQGELVYEHRLQPLTRRLEPEVLYPGKYTEAECGGIRYRCPGRADTCWMLETDLEAAFRIFCETLSQLKEDFAGIHTLPLFGRLCVTASLSEADEDLPVRFERFSPLELLHEEIYFGALAAFDPLCRERSSGRLRTPGLVLPVVSQALRQPLRITIEVSAADADLSRTEEQRPLELSAIREEDACVVLDADAPPSGWALLDGALCEGVEVRFPDRVQHPRSVAAAAPPTAPYRPEEACDLAAAVAAATGCWSWVEEVSFAGRSIPVLAYAPCREGVFSLRKLARRLPTLLVVAGHHANETSSTVSALQFVAELGRRQPNLVAIVIPMENPDGAATDRLLRAEHPHWMMHAARFNALGHEFGADQGPTPFGEARVRRRLADDYAADVILDDHGVPAHEWAQPYSGRSSPPLFPLSYTFPSGLFYGIGAGDAASGELDAAVLPYWQRVVQRLDGRPQLKAMQQELWQRYARYGSSHCPADYPSRLRDGWPLQISRRKGRADGVMTFVTEVADEGAPPELLEACIAAHLEADLAFVEVLTDRR